MASAVRNGSTPATVTATETWTPHFWRPAGVRRRGVGDGDVPGGRFVRFRRAGSSRPPDLSPPHDRGVLSSGTPAGIPGSRPTPAAFEPPSSSAVLNRFCSRVRTPCRGRTLTPRIVLSRRKMGGRAVPDRPGGLSISADGGAGADDRARTFRYAVRTRRIRVSPAEDVPLPHPTPTGVVEVVPFPLELLLQVVETQRAVAGRYADVTLVLALTGLRLGELRGLRVRAYPLGALSGCGGRAGKGGRCRSRIGCVRSSRSGPLVERRTSCCSRRPRVATCDAVGALVDDGSRSAPSGPAAHRCESVDCRWCRHQDGVGVAGSLDGETDARHLWPPDGDRRRPGGPGACEPGSRGPAGGPGGFGADS